MAVSSGDRHRVLAVLALVSAALLVLTVTVLLVTMVWALLLGLVGLALLAFGGWNAITEHRGRRRVGIAVASVGAIVLVLAVLVGMEQAAERVGVLLAVGALAAAVLLFARAAVSEYLDQLDLARVLPAFQPAHPVLLCNPKSGDGKVERFDLVARAEAMGVEVRLLEPDADLVELARDAVSRGADCLGMAGGDGSQALVADVAVEHGLPFVCIASGTRNHFAQDLGLDRGDPSTGLAAFRGGVLRRVDLARAGGRLFVNNVSLGAYAQIVGQDGYRDAKLATARQELPEMLGGQTEAFDLQFTTPEGDEVDGAFVLLVSNNPYVLGPSLDLAQRRSLTGGVLGVAALDAASGAGAAAALALSALGRGPAEGVLQFTTTRFRVRSRGGRVEAAIDGEAAELDTPVDFTIEPRGLRVLVPADNPEVLAARHVHGLGLRGLWDIARGRRPRSLEQLR